MCSEIWVNGKLHESLGELIATVGRENIVPTPADDANLEGCLCGVNAVRTAAKYGMVAIRETMGYEFVPAEPT